MTIKTALSFPKVQFLSLERWRKDMGLSRSAFFQNLVAEWLRRHEEEKMIQQYIAGYKRMPESRQEMAETKALMKLQAQEFQADDWSKA